MERLKELSGELSGLVRQLTFVQKVALAVLLAVFGGGWAWGVLHEAGAPPLGLADAAAGPTPEQQGDDASVVTWLEGGSNWFDPPGRFNTKLLEAKRLEVEKAILWHDDVARARIMIHRDTQRTLRAKPRVDSAAVMLRLKEGAPRFGRSEDVKLRNSISKAFHLEAENISVTYIGPDFYSYDGLSGGGDLNEPSPYEVSLKQNLTRLLRRVYHEDEFELAVNVHYSRRAETVQKKEFQKDDSFSLEAESFVKQDGSGGLGGFEKHTVEETYPSVEWRSTTIPAGEIHSVHVNLLVDVQAVRRLLEQDVAAVYGMRPRTARVSMLSGDVAAASDSARAHLRQQEDFIKNLVNHKETNVKVMMLSFRSPGVELEMAPDILPPPLAAEEAASAAPWWQPEPGSSMTWGYVFLAVCALALVSLGLGIAAFLRRWGAAKAAGAAAPAAFDDGDSGDFPDDQRLAGEGATRANGRSAVEAASFSETQRHDAEGVLRSVDARSRQVSERPEAAASVLRLWLAQDEPREEALE